MRNRLVPLAALALVLTACGGAGDSATTAASTSAATNGDVASTSATTTGDVANGVAIYAGTCIACHGPNGEGIEGLGKPWVGSDFINSHTDEELVAFLQVGRASDDPLNTTGIGMMPRGGNPSLTDADLLDLVAYMRTLNLTG